MRIGFRSVVVVSASLFLAIACLGGENQCLNPQPDLPSCRGNDSAGHFGGALAIAGAPGSNIGNPSSGGSSPTGGSGSGSVIVDQDGGPPNEGAAGSDGDLAGAGGDSAMSEPPINGGAGGAGGAAGSDNPP